VTELMTLEEVCAYLKRKPAAVRSLVARGQLPYRKLGGRRIVFLRDELDRWILSSPGLTLEQMKKREGAA
jgi:excisionase family DNA binding protein